MKIRDHSGKYIKLRQQYPYFRFVDFTYTINNNELDIRFTFDLAGRYTFSPGLKMLHRDFFNLQNLSREGISNMVFHIGMVELISYWKMACSPTLIIEPYSLSTEQLDWWKKLYYHGLGEFFYLNGITPDRDNFVDIQTKGTQLQTLKGTLSSEKVIIPVGGGKDSIVTLELLKETDLELIPMVLNPREASARTIETAGFELNKSIVVERTLDPLMIELNTQGFLNGHTPFSALLAFINVMTAMASGTRYVALSNENSASESTVPGSNINHQYSKSFEFEQDFAFYSKKYLHPEFEYFSFLRPLNELQISKLFSSFPAHFSGFRSCNVGSKEDQWCGKCPKCLFTYIILSPFVAHDQLRQIFGNDLLDDAELKPIFYELTGKSPVKPFECVGTPDETRSALYEAYSKTKFEKRPRLLKDFFPETYGENSFSSLVTSFQTENLLPTPFLKVLMGKLNINLDTQFQLFVRSKFGWQPQMIILGFGKEGQSTYKLLRYCYPELTIHIADKSKKIKEIEIISKDSKLVFHLGDNYQSELGQFPIILKSPGVKVTKSISQANHMYSQADLFLEFFRDQTIGITGTKGKSTTSSLIYHLLEKSGKDAILIGNIGIPPFDMLFKINPQTTVVYEMSAHQLEYVHHSPHIGVLLNIFPEHLDHFDNLDDYKEAKHHIFRNQKPGDIAIIHDEFALETKGSTYLFGMKSQKSSDAFYTSGTIIFSNNDQQFELDGELKLNGDHNMLNIMAAMLAVSGAGIDFKTSFSHLNSFRPLPHRLEFVGNYQHIDFYNDSISTVPESTMAAIKTLQNVKTILLGGYDRGIDYKGLVSFLVKSEIENFLFIGKAGETMIQLFNRYDAGKNLVKVTDIQEAVNYAIRHTVSGKCLLSPAAASYDQFHNFEHRGDTFKQCIEQYIHKKSG